MHRSLVLGFLRAEILDEEDQYLPYWETLHTDKEVEAPSVALATSTDVSAALEVRVGIASIDGWRLRVAASLGAGSSQSKYGEIGIDLGRSQVVVDQTVGSTGWTESVIAVPPQYAGITLWIQALAESNGAGDLSRVSSVLVP